MPLNQTGRELGLYVHLPFCPSRCPYCDFYAAAFNARQAKQLFEALPCHLERAAGLAQGRPLSTLYLGGGTPAMLPTAWLGGLLEAVRACLTVEPGAEVTIEANPGALGARKLQLLYGLGINRLSLGVQAMSPRELEILGRRHSVRDVLRSAHQARQAGFSNLSLDLIYGIPQHDTGTALDGLMRALELKPDHISLYELTLSPHTPFGQSYEKGKPPLPDEDDLARFEERAAELLHQAGLERYEVSNYARPGYECRHNQSTWRGGDYLALGPGAHGHLAGRRWAHVSDAARYSAMVLQGREPLEFSEALSPLQRAQELIILGLRTTQGVDLSAVQRILRDDPLKRWTREIAELKDLGWASIKDSRLMPSRAGLARADAAARLFM